MSKKILIFIILIVAIVLCYALFQLPEQVVEEGGKYCSVDDDCVVFGETGDCNCGCYNKENLPSLTEGECFCAAPTSCKCADGTCEGVFVSISNFEECVEAGYPIFESYPRQCVTSNEETFIEEYCANTDFSYIMTLEKAKEIAINSECGDTLKESYMCNEITGTYWIDLDIEKEGCNPACVINIETEEAEINWRCTGLIE